jgi:hypothetical protein
LKWIGRSPVVLVSVTPEENSDSAVQYQEIDLLIAECRLHF